MKTKKWYLIVFLFLFVSSTGSSELCAIQTSFSFRSSISSLYTKFKEWSSPKTIGIGLLAGAVCLVGCKFFNLFPFKKPLEKKLENEGKKVKAVVTSTPSKNDGPKEEEDSSDEFVSPGKEEGEPSDDDETSSSSRDSSPVKRMVRFAETDQVICVRNTLPKLHGFINFLKKEIKSILDCENAKGRPQALLGSFILVDGLRPEEIDQEFGGFTENIRSEIAVTTDESWLTSFSEQLQQQIDEIEEFREGVAVVVSLIADSDEELFEQVEQRYDNLIAVGVEREGAYEVLGFEKEKRNKISIGQICKAYKELSERYNATETAEGKKVRQAGYTLSNPYGKQLYDAFLSGNEHLAMMRVSQQEASDSGIDFMNLSTKLITIKNGIELIKKDIDKKLK